MIYLKSVANSQVIFQFFFFFFFYQNVFQLNKDTKISTYKKVKFTCVRPKIDFKNVKILASTLCKYLEENDDRGKYFGT